MTAESKKGAGDWRGTRSRRSDAGPKRTSATKWTEAALVSMLLLVVAGLAVWLGLMFVRPTNPTAYFVPFWVGTYHDRLGIPTVPWTRADRDAIVGDKHALFTMVDKKEAPDQPLETIKERLDGLLERAGDDAVVVYISAFAVVDTEGKIRILAKDSHPYEPETQLPLSKVLDAMEHCESKNKLLVLDIMRNMLDPRDMGGTTDGVGDLVSRELQDGKDPDKLKDPNLIVICACSKGQTALGSENLAGGRSAFGYFFERALATNEADTNRDNVIHVQELQKYLARNVEDWALRYRGVSQIPHVAGAIDRDFPLRTIQAARNSGGLASLWTRGTSKAASTVSEPADDMPDIEEKPKSESSEPSAGDTKSSTKEEEVKKTEKTTPKEKSKGADEPSSPSGRREYPGWLASGWDTYHEWWKSGDFRAAPRVFRTLGAILLRAERRWRGGDDERDVRQDLERELQAGVSAMGVAKKISLPTPCSAGLAVALGMQPDAALKGAIEDALVKWREIPPDDPKAQEARTAIVKGPVGLIKGKTPIEFALALVAASQKRPLDSQTVTFLESIVDQSRTNFDDKDPRGQVVELRFLHQLADRSKAASQAGDWWDLADKAWRTVQNAEQASFQPQALARVRARLAEADASLHDAQILLLTRPQGYASWKRQIDDAWEKSAGLYQTLRDQQNSIRRAQISFAKTLTVLSFLIPYLEAKTDPELQDDWLDAAKTAQDVALLLDPPQEGETTADQIDAKITKLSGGADELEAKCQSLLSRFEPAALKKFVANCNSDTVAPDPARIVEIEALLVTPFPTSSDRRELRDAVRSLEARLKHSNGTNLASSSSAKTDPPRSRAKNRFDRIVEFLKLCGSEGKGQQLKGLQAYIRNPKESTGRTEAKVDWSKAEVDKVWRAMADITEYAYRSFSDRLRNDKLIDDIDAAGLLAPAYALGLVDSKATKGADNACRAARERDSLKACSWLAAHYRHQGLDLSELADPDRFYEAAATNCPTDSPPEAYPRIQVLDANGRPVSDQDPVKLTMENRQGQVTLELRLENSDAANAADGVKTELSIVQSADTRLQVSRVPDELNLSTELRRLKVEFELSADGNGSRVSPPSEFFVALRMENGRKYHARIPIKIVTGELIPRLVLSTDSTKLKKVAEDKIRLRPIPGLRQPSYLFVENQTDRAVAVTVAVLEGSTVRARAGTKENPIKVKAPGSEPVRSFVGGSSPKDGDPLPGLVEPIKIQLRDAVTDDLIQELPVPVVVASPRDYIQVTGAEFIPERPGDPNRLTVILNPLDALGDRPCPVELVLPEDPDLFPAYKGQPKEGRQAGVLEAGGRGLILNAQRIPLNTNVDETKPSYFYLNVDGLEKADAVRRAIWFKTTFRQEGNRQAVTEDMTARVRFAAELAVSKDSAAKLQVKFAVDNPPPDAKLKFQLVRDEGGRDTPAPSVSWSAAAKDKRLGFDIKGETGTLEFEASVKDWDRDFKVAGIHGMCRLEARLVDATGRDVAEPYSISMELDDRAPQNMAINAPARIDQGTHEIVVVASVTPPPTMKEVSFVVGTKKVTDADFDKAEQEGKTVKGLPVDNDRRNWKATIKVPADATEKLLVTARFKPVAGLTSLYSTDVAIVDSAPAPKEKAKAAMEPPKPGSIEGTVAIAGRPQPDLVVFLLDTDPNTKKLVVDQVTTTDKGTYKFTDVPPKTYNVYCYKKSDGRKDARAATVKPGEKLTIDLKLVQ